MSTGSRRAAASLVPPKGPAAPAHAEAVEPWIDICVSRAAAGRFLRPTAEPPTTVVIDYERRTRPTQAEGGPRLLWQQASSRRGRRALRCVWVVWTLRGSQAFEGPSHAVGGWEGAREGRKGRRQSIKALDQTFDY